MGQAWGESNCLVGGLYTLWQCTDHVVTFVHPKTKVVPLTRQLPMTTTTTNECCIHLHPTLPSAPSTTQMSKCKECSPNNANQLFGPYGMFSLLTIILLTVFFFSVYCLLIMMHTTNRPDATIASHCSQGGSGLCF